MLFVLTGQIQTGKTRWLEGLIGELEGAGVSVCGVVAPGVWADRRDDPASYPHADSNGFEKLGIDNVLLPSGQRVAFARRADLALSDGGCDPSSQSSRAKLMWDIPDDAIERVNGHFASLRSTRSVEGIPAYQAVPEFLVVDEFGRLELECGGGLTQAVGMLEDGPSLTMRNALIVVREGLLPALKGRFENWGKIAYVHPDDASRKLIFTAVTG